MAPKLKIEALLWSACALAVLAASPPRAQAQATEVVLHDFASPPKGEGLWAGVIRDKTSNLYGTAVDGGPANLGVVFKVDTAGHTTVLHGFTGGSDGERPYAGVVGDSAGNLYGTAYLGGTYDAGIVYKVDAAGHETVLYTFTGGSDGGMPIAGVTLDSAGNLYGCASAGGSANDGVVFKLDPTGQETVLHNFTGSPGDGASPQAAPLLDSAGNLYGTTYSGGTFGGSAGTVWKVDATGHETVLYNFGGADGYAPYAGVVRDSAGNLFGATSGGGAGGNGGTVYKLDTAGNQTVLYSFTGGADGGLPIGGVVRDSAGNLYGATETGGAAGANRPNRPRDGALHLHGWG